MKPRSTFAAITSAITGPIDRNPFTALALAAAVVLGGCGMLGAFDGRAADPADGTARTAAALESAGRAAIIEATKARDSKLAQARRLIDEANADDEHAQETAAAYADAIEQANAGTERIRAAVDGLANLATVGLGPVGAVVPLIVGAGFAIDNRRKDRLLTAYKAANRTATSRAPSA